MTVRSVRLGEGDSAPAGTPKVIYTCPSGVTAVLKDVRLDTAASSPTRAAVQLSSGGSWHSIMDGPRSALATPSVTGFIVLQPGQQVRLYSEGGTFSCVLSGAELDGVAP